MTRAIFRILVLFPAVVMLIACEDSDREAGGIKPDPDIESLIEQNFRKYQEVWEGVRPNRQFQCTADSQDAFSCVKEACSVAGGEFDGDHKFCDCGPGLIFSAYYAKCLPPLPSKKLEDSGWIRRHARPKTVLRLAPSHEQEVLSSSVANHSEFSRLNFPYTFLFKAVFLRETLKILTSWIFCVIYS